MTTLVRQRLVSRLWQAAAAATYPVDPAEYLDMFRPLRSGADLRARVVRVRAETADAVTVVLRPGKAWRGHLPGQYVRIGVDVDGVRLWRSYSLTSAPDAPDGLLAITAKAVAGGLVSAHLAQDLRPGQLVHLDQALGDFVLPDPAPGKVLFVTGGSGITPVMGMLRSGLDRLHDVVLVHSAASADDVIFGSELRAMADSGRLRLVEQHTDSQGRLDVAALAALVPDLAERQTWACGPAGLLDAIEQQWADLGQGQRLHTERFRAAALAEPGQGGTVTFSGTGTTAEADGSTPILDAGERAGVLMPSGCRMGICFSCVLPLRQGSVRDLRSGDVTTAVPGDGVLIQTCVSAAAGPCDIDH
ncbi:ferredoxin-NADP reductase [Allocatelliglobosispora scoriae]|uniref:Ferredoxin-NADP reductase n=1 Tax=Allocatelliglobosispora scoriae TaxID=643052 RepID=A0A841BKE1_9ACTN|nr:ferredoxin reductase [Allocatelliglobosispora scoriae]MBB5867280.1 ferredoxin-NADP reductase [Allocatelliglobosispora scoriae]